MKKSTKHLPRESLGDSYNSVLDTNESWVGMPLWRMDQSPSQSAPTNLALNTRIGL